MYYPDEIVTVKWSNNTRKHFEEKGYIFTHKDDEFQVKVKDLDKTSNVPVTVTCDCEGCNNTIKLHYRNYNKAIEKYGMYRCKECSHMDNIRIRTEKSHDRLYNEFLQKCKEHNCIPVTTRENFGGSSSFVEYICPIHGKTKSYMNNVINNNAWCYWCGKMSMAEKQKLTADEVKKIVESKNNNILLNPDEYINIASKNLRIICGSCNQEYIASLSSIVNSEGRCSCCGEKMNAERLSQMTRIPLEEMIQRTSINGTPMVINPEDYTTMGEKLLFYCSECGKPFEQSPFNYGRGFTRCKDCWTIFESKAVAKIKKILDNLNISYTTEYRYEDCKDIKPLPFDFYLNDYNLIIEYDGQHHYYAIDFFGGEEHLHTTQKHDSIKNEYCKDHNIPLLRIPYWEEELLYDRIIEFLKINNVEDIV